MRHSSQSSPPEPLPAPRIPDHELLKQVGSGAYGEVWLARSSMGSFRAVKIVYRARFDRDQPYEREFAGIRNFEPVSRGHRNHVDVLHVGINESEGYFYYVMEAADDEATGQEIDPEAYSPKNLQRELQRRRQLPSGECLSLAIALTEALSHLHDHGLIHRDIKPSNIIYLRGQARLADIGLVSRFDATVSIVGTDGFMPPEGHGSPQADIYSLGKVLYEMATGNDRQRFPELPSFTDGPASSEQKSLAELNQVILRACETDPRHRYPSAAAMREDLQLLQSGESVLRLRRLERRLGQAKKIAAVAGVLLLAGTGAFFYQAQHAAIVRGMAEENRALAERHRDHLVDAYLEAGARELEEGANHHALRSFALALEAAQGDPEREASHLLRLNALIRQHPKLLGVLKHDGWVRYAEFSADGRRVITASDDGTARIWDAFTGAPLSAPLAHDGQVNMARFSPDGARVLTASYDGTATIWEAESGDRAAVLPHDGIVYQARFSPDGERVLTSSADGTARLWTAGGAPVSPPLDHGSEIYWTEFSADGRRFVTAGSDGIARLWNSATGEAAGHQYRHDGPVYYARFSPDGELLAIASGDGTVGVWRLKDGELAFPRIPLSGELIGTSFSPCGRYLAVADRSAKKLQIIAAETGQELREFKGNMSLSPRFSPDGAYIAYSYYGNELRIANIHTDELLVSPLKNAWFDGASFSPDGHRIAVPSVRDGLVKIWDFAADGLVAAEIEAGEPVGSVAYSLDGSRLATAGARAQVWDAATGAPVSPPLETESDVLHVEFSPDGEHLLTASGPFFTKMGGNAWSHTHEVNVWNATTGEMRHDPIGPGGCIHFARFSPDGQKIVTAGADQSARLWSADTGKAIGEPLQHNFPVWHASFSPDSSRLIASAGHTAHVWDLETGKLLMQPLKHEQLVDQGIFTPDGGAILTGSYHQQALRLWDAQQGKNVSQLKMPGNVTRFQICRNGERLLTFGFGCARLLDLTAINGQQELSPVSEPICHEGVMTFATMDPEARYLWTECDTWGRLWDGRSAAPLAVVLPRPDTRDAARALRRGTPATPAAFHPLRPELAVLAGETRVEILALKKEIEAVEDLVSFASILGAKPQFKNSTPEQDGLFKSWSHLAKKYPARFTTCPESVWRWHRGQAERLWQASLAAAAEWHWERMVKLRPYEPDGYLGRIRTARLRGDWRKERDALATVLALRDTVRDRYELALVLLAAQQLEAYRDLAVETQARLNQTRHFPSRLLAAWISALAPGGARNPRALAIALQEGAKGGSHGANAEVENTLGALSYRAGDMDGAAAHLRRARQLGERGGRRVSAGSPARTAGLLALVQLRQGDDEQATKNLQILAEWMLRAEGDAAASTSGLPGLMKELRILQREAIGLMPEPQWSKES